MAPVQLNIELFNNRLKHLLDAWNVSYRDLISKKYPALTRSLSRQAKMKTMSQSVQQTVYFLLQETQRAQTNL